MAQNQVHRMLGKGAASQHGVFTLEQARDAGVPPRSVTNRALAGRYTRLQPGVYAIAGAPGTTQRRVSAAVASFPALAAVSHQTAADMWGLTSRGVASIDVVTTRWDRVHRPQLTVHESLDLVAEDVVVVDGIPVTTAARTVVDLGASNKWIVERALEEGIRRDLFTLGEVEAFVARVGRRGRRGVGVIRPLLVARSRWDSATESALEDRFRNLLADVGLLPPEPQFVLRAHDGSFVCRADFAYPKAHLLIELDSEAHHLDRLTFRRDRAKQNRATTLGWTVLRYTWWDLLEHPNRVCREIGALLSDTPKRLGPAQR